ncbi:MAG: autoinducer binding domain-containing protein [Coxiellaceae bacterium]|nr:autoinducer binding domain-containing protein [Coxiellaceae bacterium]
MKIQQHPCLQNSDAIKAVCKPLEAFGISYFAYVQVNHKQQFFALGNHPEFAECYLEKQYYNCDVHLDTHYHQGEHFILWDYVETASLDQGFADDFDAFGLGHTFSIIRNYRDIKECFHFATPKSDTVNAARCWNHLEELKRFIAYFKETIQQHRSLRLVYQTPFQINAPKKTIQLNKQALILPKDYKTKRIPYKNTYITRKEFECLHWLANGKTAAQIALILQISERTVHAHIRNMKQRLNHPTMFQLGMIYQDIQG